MKHTGWILAAVSLVLIQGAPAGAGSLQVLVEPGRVAVQAEEVPLGRILEALSERGGMHVLIDERRATQLVTVRLEAGEIQEAIVRLMQEAGGGNYAIVRTDAHGKLETLLFQDPGEGTAAAAQPTQPAYEPAPTLPSTLPFYVADPVGGGAAYPEAGTRAPDYGSPTGSPTPYPTPSPGGGGAADAPAAKEPVRRVDPALSSLTNFEEFERAREEREGRRGTKDFD